MLHNNNLFLQVPTIYNVTICNVQIKNTNCNYFYISNNNYFGIFYSNLPVKFDVVTNSLVFSLVKTKLPFNLMYWYWNNFIPSLERLFFEKLTFKGKSFKITRKKKKFYDFDFGHAHYTYVIFFNIIFKKRKKYQYYIKRTNYFWFCRFLGEVMNLRQWNMYTQRGLRLKRQLLFKKTGKVSTYV